MFPNPQAALPLPPHPNLEQYRKLAKDLVKACKSTDPDAIGGWAKAWIEALVALKRDAMPRRRAGIERTADDVGEFARRTLKQPEPRGCRLADAQFVIARSHGFDTWPTFASHLEALNGSSNPVAQFELAADAIVTGDIATLRRLLREDRELIRARSSREHRATLLIYAAANGVEGYRQLTPGNILEITKTLLDAGAEVEATADVYGGDCTTLLLTATSGHPRKAGLQIPLLELLIEHGAAFTRLRKGRSIVREALANGCPEAAAYLAERGVPLDVEGACALGRLEVVESFLSVNSNSSEAAMKMLQDGFFWACGYGQKHVVEFLLDKGLDIAAQDGDGQTGLHHAVMGGHIGTVTLLLERKAPLEVKNVYGGTVLGQTLWSAGHGGPPDVFVRIIEALLAAGTRLNDRHVPVNDRIDELLLRHGSRPEPAWAWYGEKPGTA